MERLLSVAHEVIGRCHALAEFTEEPGHITRTFLSPPMRGVHAQVRQWMEAAGMSVRVDAAGNIRGVYAGQTSARLLIGSHLDTVPHAGAFDGILGVILGITLVESLGGRRLPFQIEVIGFSEEEGVKFGVPFIGSRAVIGDLDPALIERISPAIADFGLDPAQLAEARLDSDALGYLEFHIEQGPVLENLDCAVAVVEAIAGQSRFEIAFRGDANHAATPMLSRRDALAAAAEWISAVEREALAAEGLLATVGSIEVEPGAANVIAGVARASLDVRHGDDAIRAAAAGRLLGCAQTIAARRGVTVASKRHLDRPAVRMDAALVSPLERAVARAGHPVHRMTSGAGHDAMILAPIVPAAMLFVRSPGGVSHHPAETVLPEDVTAALQAGMSFLEELEARHA